MSTDSNSPKIDQALVFVTNDEFRTGFLATFASALSASNLEQFNLYIGHDQNESIGGIWDEVVQLCQRFNFPIERCQRVAIDLTFSKKYKPFANGSHTTYARHYLATILKERTFLYLDSDMLVLDDLSKLVNRLPDDTQCAAVQDRCILTHAGDPYHLDGKAHSNDESPYFNSGLLILNTDTCRELQLLDRFNELQPRLSNLKFTDQTLINLIFKDRWVQLPARWNAITIPADPSPLTIEGEQVGILHFAASEKPWKAAHLDSPNILWHCVARQLGIEVDPAVNEALDQLIDKYNNLNRFTLRLKAILYRMRKSKRRNAIKAEHWLDKKIDLHQIEAWLKEHGFGILSKSFPNLSQTK